MSTSAPKAEAKTGTESGTKSGTDPGVETGRTTGGTTAVENLFRRHLENPFLVLALPPGASAAALEREGQKLLAMLAAHLDEAATYATPFGPYARTPELVRAAMAELRDPERRLRHEWWARGWSEAAT